MESKENRNKGKVSESKKTSAAQKHAKLVAHKKQATPK